MNPAKETTPVPKVFQHRRRSIRLHEFDYSQPGGYFVTLVTHRRECLFGEIHSGVMQCKPLGRIAYEEWFRSVENRPYLELREQEFVVMPNHVHGILWIQDIITQGDPGELRKENVEKFQKPVPGSLPTIIRAYKAAVSRRAGRELGLFDVWQRNYYEHVLRGQQDWEMIAGYILANPQNWEKDEENPGL